MNQGGVSGHLAGRFEELGGSLRGSVVAGEQVKVEQSTLLQNRDFPVLNDDRAVLAGLFARQYGLSAARNE